MSLGPKVMPARPSSSSRTRPSWSRRAGAPSSPRKDHLVLDRTEALMQRRAIGTKADPVMLEVFNNLFMSIAEQMGVTLQNTAYSVNIKERLDFSCAVFDADGALVANAPHMPVHLGSMDRSVETMIRATTGSIRPGDVYAPRTRPITAAPICPTSPSARRSSTRRTKKSCSGWRARGHHADIGGIAPGSMSPLATDHRGGRRLYRQFQAGRPGPVPRGGADRAADRRRSYPARNVRCRTSTTSRRRSPPTRRASRSLRKMIALVRPRRRAGLYGPCAGQRRRERPPRASTSCTIANSPIEMDQGCAIKVKITVDKREARGHRRLHRHLARSRTDNFNAPEPVTRAAVLYVFRVMVDDDDPDECGVPAADQASSCPRARC